MGVCARSSSARERLSYRKPNSLSAGNMRSRKYRKVSMNAGWPYVTPAVTRLPYWPPFSSSSNNNNILYNKYYLIFIKCNIQYVQSVVQ